MNFHKFQPLFPIFKKLGTHQTAEGFYDEAWNIAAAKDDPTLANRCTAEKLWIQDRCPYYNVYPSIVPMLTRLKLDIDSALIKLPMEVLEIRLPTNKNVFTWEQDGKEESIRCLLISGCNLQGQGGITIWMDLGERQKPIDIPTISLPVYTYRNFPTAKGVSVESTLDLEADMESLAVGLQLPTDVEMDCLRLVCTLCLIGNDAELISPDVLVKDREKFEKTLDPKFVKKAHRRGKKGWNIGAGMEVIPHIRRPHPALVWYGPKKSLCKIVMRKGSIVHRETVERIPTGRENSVDGSCQI